MWFYHSLTFKSRRLARVEKNNGKMLLSAIHNTRVSCRHSVRLSYFLYIWFNLFYGLSFHHILGGWFFTVVLGVAVGKFLQCNVSVFVFSLCHAGCSRSLRCSKKATGTDGKLAALLIKSHYLALPYSEISVIQMFLSPCSFPLPFVPFSFLVLFLYPDSTKWTLGPSLLVISSCTTFADLKMIVECHTLPYAVLSLKFERILGIGTKLWNPDWGRCPQDMKRLSLFLDWQFFIYQCIVFSSTCSFELCYLPH